MPKKSVAADVQVKNVKARPKTPALGRQLRRQREQARQTRSAVCRALHSTYGLVCDRSTLLQYESGTVKAPDPAILWGLSRHYGVDCESLLLTLVRDRTGLQLRADVDIAMSPYTPEQRFVAESYGLMSTELQRSFLLLLYVVALTDDKDSKVLEFQKRFGRPQHHEETPTSDSTHQQHA